MKLHELINRHGLEVLDHLDTQVAVPVITDPQCQGDLIVLPSSVTGSLVPVPAKGIALVQGESGGNTHTLLADGPVVYRRLDTNDGLGVCMLSVADGAVAYLAHPEHGYTGIGAGSYVIRRQREQADEIRRVAD